MLIISYSGSIPIMDGSRVDEDLEAIYLAPYLLYRKAYNRRKTQRRTNQYTEFALIRMRNYVLLQ